MHSPNFTDENIAKLAAIFPGCVTESADEDGNLQKSIDFDQLKQELSTHIVEGPQERYHLNWPGKREALLTANASIAKTLRPCREESVDFDNTENLFIEGDNLDALKLLQETYLGKVKMIYIDPPYNTGNDFIYADDFAENTEVFLKRSSQKDEQGNRLIANTESNGRFHSDWLSLMFSRLKLARNLLREDGLIFISIDDDEVTNTCKLCNEIFGEYNYVATLVWDRNRKNDAKYFSVGHEYMVCYFKNASYVKDDGVVFRAPKEGVDEVRELFNKLRKKHDDNWPNITSEILEYYATIPDEDPRTPIKRFRKVDVLGPFRDDGNINWPGGGGPRYEVLHPITKRACKLPKSGWRYPTPSRFWEEVDKGRIVFGEDETTVPRVRTNLFDNKDQVMKSVHYSYAQTATNQFLEIFDGARIFDNPKAISDLVQIIRYVSDPGDLIVDFFAGSATTAHAVMQVNAEDNGKRKFIMVQLPEECDEKSEAFKEGYETIAEIGKERIRRAGKKIKKESTLTTQNLDTGFRVLKVDSSNMADIYYTPDAVDQKQLSLLTDNIKADRTSEDLLFQILLDWGVDLTLPITREIIDNREVFFVDNNALAACFVKNGQITEDFCKELAKHQPLRVVFRDSGFKDDSVKINVEQIFKLMSPHTEVKCI